MFGKDNNKKPLVETVAATPEILPGEVFVLLKQKPEGLLVLTSANFNNDVLALFHMMHLALANLTAAMVQESAKEKSRIIQVPPGTTLRKPQ